MDEANVLKHPAMILHLETREADRVRVRSALQVAGLVCTIVNATSAGEFAHALEAAEFDFIIAGFDVPGCAAEAALDHARTRRPAIPFFQITDPTYDALGIENLNRGAAEYIRREYLERLAPAMRRTLRNSTSRIELESRLHQSQKLEALGQLAGGVAHDFNNVLTVVTGYARLLLDNGNPPADMVEPLTQIYTAGVRAANLTRQLLMFSRKQSLRRQRIDLNDLVDEMGALLRPLIGEHIRLILSRSSQPAVTEADGAMIEQVIMNLAINARDAMPEGGTLTISIEPQRISQIEPHEAPDARTGDFICLAVRDTGHGIPSEIRSHIFEPFFTTKEPGHGTGLGLATVFGIVAQHQGWIDLASTVGAGTSFQVMLPASNLPVAARPSVQPAHTPTGGTEVVLLVEDESAVREFGAAVLRGHGYRVLQAATGAEALEVWQWHAPRISLLFSDMVLPDGMSGIELAAHLRRDKPTIRVVLTSGYTGDESEPHLELPTGIHFIRKPYKPKALAQTVRDAIDGVSQQ